jgi:dsDNA-specific endonuclease/ATPase MutS2
VALVGSEVALFRIDSQSIEKIDPQVLKDMMVEGTKSSQSSKDTPAGLSEDTVDLHIDSNDPMLSPNQVLEYQIEKFEKAYDRALLMNLRKLKIIHGVGAGILRSEIHKRLSKKQEVKYFEDGDKERFGFGSTIIYF